MLLVNYQSWKSKLTKFCQEYELKSLSTAAFRAFKILATEGVDISVNHNFQSSQNPVNNAAYISVDHSFQSY